MRIRLPLLVTLIPLAVTIAAACTDWDRPQRAGPVGPSLVALGSADSGDTTDGDTVPPDTVPPDTTPPDTLPPDTIPPDTIPPDTIPPDTIPPDTIPPDTIPPDTIPPDTIPPDTIPPDTIPGGGDPVFFDVNAVVDGCSGEAVQLSGRVWTRFRTLVLPPGNGILTFALNYRDVAGIGLRTGAVYRGRGTERQVHRFATLPFSDTYVAEIRLIRQGRGANLRVRFDLHVLINIRGEVIPSARDYRAVCH